MKQVRFWLMLCILMIGVIAASARADTIDPINFYSGQQAQDAIDNQMNIVFDWSALMSPPCDPNTASAPHCTTNKVVDISPILSAFITTPQNIGWFASDGGMSTQGYVDLHFSSPIEAAGLALTDGYRFNWLVGLEAFAADGTSLGKAEQSGWDQVRPPTTTQAVVADSDLIASIRLYTNDEQVTGGAFSMSALHIGQAPEPQTWAMFAGGVGLMWLGRRKRTTARPSAPAQ